MAVEAARRVFPRCWFNEKTTEAGRDALGYYHERQDEKRNVGLGPEHDWSSHTANAFGYILHERARQGNAGYYQSLERLNRNGLEPFVQISCPDHRKVRGRVRRSEGIADWLEKLGMSEYADRFAENRIDLSVLPDLTDQHLKDLGVALADRLKTLRAIGELTGASPAAPQFPAATKPAQQDTAERRQVTVMFSDLVGSTALSARMDPEDLHEVISAYQKCVAETVRRFGGFVAKYMGDGVLIYFGYPQAHEDDAERAVRTGLELIPAVSALNQYKRRHFSTTLSVPGSSIVALKQRAVIGPMPGTVVNLRIWEKTS